MPFRQPACDAQGRRLSFPAASLPRLRFDRKVAYKALIRNRFLVKGASRKKIFPEFSRAAGNRRGRRKLFPAASLRPAKRLPARRPLLRGANYLIDGGLWPIWRVISGAESSFHPALREKPARQALSAPNPLHPPERRKKPASSTRWCRSPSDRSRR